MGSCVCQSEHQIPPQANAVTWPLEARAQQSERVRRIGVLMSIGDPTTQSYVTAFRGALTKLGWAEGSNLRTEVRWGAGDADKFRSFAKELVDLRPDAIVGQSTPVVAALARETQTIPIVFLNVADPIGSGFVVSLARPGGNLTGFMTDNSALGGKWVELLKEIAPRTVRAALMFNPTTAVPLKVYMPSVQAAASTLGVEVNATPVHAWQPKHRRRIKEGKAMNSNDLSRMTSSMVSMLYLMP